MDIEIFTLCDYAQDYGGKLLVVGTFDTIFSPVFPAAHGQCAIALRLRFEPTEVGEHRVSIVLVDADGRELNRVDGQLNVRTKPQQTFATANLALTIRNLPFQSAGDYAFNLGYDGEHVTALPLLVRLRPQG